MKKILVIIVILTLITACSKHEEQKPVPQETKKTLTREEIKKKLQQELKEKEKKQIKQEKTPEQLELDKQLLEVIIRNPDLEEIKRLLKEGADVNATHLYADYPTSPLYLAIDTGNIELINTLIVAGAKINFEDYDCGEGKCGGHPSSPLIKAVRLGNEGTINLLLGNGADINMEVHSGDDFGMTALRAAVESNDKYMIDLLLKNGANDIFVALARPDLLPALLANGANINSENLYKETITDIAKKQGKEKLVQLFLENGAKEGDIKENSTKNDVYTYAYNNIDKQLEVAKEMQDTILIKKLVQYGAVIKSEVKQEAVKVKKAPAKERFEMPAPTKEENFIWAAREGHMEIATLLLSQGVSVNTKDSTTGETALIAAVDGGNIEMIKLLLEKGANVNAKCSVSFPSTGVRRDYTALSAAVANGKTRIVKLLINAGADVNMKVQSSSGDSAIAVARKHGYMEIVQLLKDAGAKE